MVADVHSTRGYFVYEEEVVSMGRKIPMNTNSNFSDAGSKTNSRSILTNTNAFNKYRNKSIEPYSNYDRDILNQLYVRQE